MYMYMYMHIYIYTHVIIYIYTCNYIYIYLYVYMYMYMYIHTCVCIHIYIYIWYGDIGNLFFPIWYFWKMLYFQQTWDDDLKWLSLWGYPTLQNTAVEYAKHMHEQAKHEWVKVRLGSHCSPPSFGDAVNLQGFFHPGRFFDMLSVFQSCLCWSGADTGDSSHGEVKGRCSDAWKTKGIPMIGQSLLLDHPATDGRRWA